MTQDQNGQSNGNNGQDEHVEPEFLDGVEPSRGTFSGDDAMAGESEGEADPFVVLQRLQTENAELKDKVLRAVAEAENVRRRAERDRTDAAKYGATKFAADMVQVSDNLRRAIATLNPAEREAADPSVKALIEGVEMTERQLISTFERHGIKEVTPAVGDKFDANLHEAMFEVPGTGQPAGSVVQVIEAGYMIGDRLLRAARVGVARD